jgi:hypothetical protein
VVTAFSMRVAPFANGGGAVYFFDRPSSEVGAVPVVSYTGLTQGAWNEWCGQLNRPFDQLVISAHVSSALPVEIKTYLDEIVIDYEIVALTPTPNRCPVFSPLVPNCQTVTPAPTLTRTPTATPNFVCTVQLIQGANLRSIPSANGALITSLSAGTIVQVTGKTYAPNEVWYRVMSASITGWVIDGTLSQTDLQAIGCQNLPPFDGTGDILPTFTATFTPTLTSLPPMLRQRVILFDPNAVYPDAIVIEDCSSLVDYPCIVHVSVRELIRDKLYPRITFTHGLLLEILVYSEYGSSGLTDGIYNWATEAMARRFYEDSGCGQDGCLNNFELYGFLSYYESAVQTSDLDEDYQRLQDDRQRAVIRPDIQLKLAKMDIAVGNILNIPPSSWLLGVGDNLPYGFASASCVLTDTNTLNLYKACGAAEVAVSATNGQPNGIIFFGTTLLTDNQGLCVVKTC